LKIATSTLERGALHPDSALDEVRREPVVRNHEVREVVRQLVDQVVLAVQTASQRGWFSRRCRSRRGR
jgi:hypothetical protein